MINANIRHCDRLSQAIRALAPEKDAGTRMKSLGLYRQMEDLYRLRALVDEINREQWIAESRKWRERAELEIESYLRLRYIVREKTVH
jgi:hypothetical protein